MRLLLKEKRGKYKKLLGMPLFVIGIFFVILMAVPITNNNIQFINSNNARVVNNMTPSSSSEGYNGYNLTIYSDDFESYSVGSDPTGWVIQENEPSFVYINVTAPHPHGASAITTNNLGVGDAQASEAVSGYKDLVQNVTDGSFEFDVSVSVTAPSSHNFTLLLTDSSNTEIIKFDFDQIVSGSTFKIGVQGQLLSPSFNSLDVVHVKLDFMNGYLNVSLNGTDYVTNLLYGASPISRLKIYSTVSGNGGDVYFDNFVLIKILSEPENIVFLDDFESYSAGSDPTGWDIQENEAHFVYIDVSSPHPHHISDLDTKSLGMGDAQSWTAASGYKDLAQDIINGSFEFDVSVSVSASSSHNFTLLLTDSGNTQIIKVDFDQIVSSSSFKIGVQGQLLSPSFNSLDVVHVKLDFMNGYLNVSLNGTDYVTNLLYVANPISRIKIYSTVSGNGGDIYFDNFVLRERKEKQNFMQRLIYSDDFESYSADSNPTGWVIQEDEPNYVYIDVIAPHPNGASAITTKTLGMGDAQSWTAASGYKDLAQNVTDGSFEFDVSVSVTASSSHNFTLLLTDSNNTEIIKVDFDQIVSGSTFKIGVQGQLLSPSFNSLDVVHVKIEFMEGYLNVFLNNTRYVSKLAYGARSISRIKIYSTVSGDGGDIYFDNFILNENIYSSGKVAIYTDDFESYSAGSDPTGWVIQEDELNYVYIDVIAPHPNGASAITTKTLGMGDAQAWTAASGYKDLAQNVTDGSFEFDVSVSVTASSSHNFTLLLTDSSNTEIIKFDFDQIVSGSTFKISVQGQLLSPSFNSLDVVHVKLDFMNGYLNVSLNGTDYVTNLLYGASPISRLKIYSTVSGNGGDIYFDNFKIFKSNDFYLVKNVFFDDFESYSPGSDPTGWVIQENELKFVFIDVIAPHPHGSSAITTNTLGMGDAQNWTYVSGYKDLSEDIINGSFEFDVSVSVTASSSHNFTLLLTDSNNTEIIKVDFDQIVSSSSFKIGVQGQLLSPSFNSLDVVHVKLDFMKGYLNVSLNDTFYATNLPYGTSSISRIKLYSTVLGNGGDIYLDNLRLNKFIYSNRLKPSFINQSTSVNTLSYTISWNSFGVGFSYLLYRSLTPITSVNGLTPIYSGENTSYQESSSGFNIYYYVVQSVLTTTDNNKIYTYLSNNLIIKYNKPSENIITLQTPVLDNFIEINTHGDYRISWNSVPNATYYLLYRLTSSDESLSSNNLIYNGSETYYEEKHMPHGQYYYVVVAANNYAQSDPSDPLLVNVENYMVHNIYIYIIIGIGAAVAIAVPTTIVLKKKKQHLRDLVNTDIFSDNNSSNMDVHDDFDQDFE